MKAYKLMRLRKDGSLGSLFIDRKAVIPIGEWLEAECIPTNGFAIRKGYHCTFKMNAPHLKMKLANGEQRVWVECLVEDYETYDRPESQGNTWILANKMKVVRVINNEE